MTLEQADCGRREEEEAEPVELTTAVFGCPDCGADFDGEADLISHRRQMHLVKVDPTIYSCLLCETEFGTEVQLEEHGVLEHPTA